MAGPGSGAPRRRTGTLHLEELLIDMATKSGYLRRPPATFCGELQRPRWLRPPMNREKGNEIRDLMREFYGEGIYILVLIAYLIYIQNTGATMQKNACRF
jgi:hypothetical protein